MGGDLWHHLKDVAYRKCSSDGYNDMSHLLFGNYGFGTTARSCFSVHQKGLQNIFVSK